MQDATGQAISEYDLVRFQPTVADHGHDRGLALAALPGETRLITVVRVDGTVVTKKASDLTIVDRSTLFPGMVVTSASDPGGQAGVVTGVATALDLFQLGDELRRVAATGVSPAEVQPVKELHLGDYVVSSGAWLGRVVELSVDVDVMFGDGSVCRVTKAGDKLRAVDGDNFFHSDKNAFYPGDAVVAGDASVFRASRWLKGHWKPSHGGEGTVAKVEMGGVLVCWVASLPQAALSPPPAYQPDTRNLTFFCSGDADRMWFWAAGERCFLRSPSPAGAGGGPDDGIERPMAIADTRTTVDVRWQDGSRQRGVPSASLPVMLVRNEYDFFPGQRVVLGNAAAEQRVGVVKGLSYKDQTVCVSWIADGEEVDTTTVSTYDLRRSSDHNFFYGDMVVRLRPRDEPAAQKSNNNDLSWVGHIVDLDAQFIHVKWGDGTMSKVLLHEIDFVKPRSINQMLQEVRNPVQDNGPVRETAIIGKVANIIQAVIRTLSGMLAQGKMYMLRRSMALALRAEPPTTDQNNDHTCPPKISDEEEAAAAAVLSAGDDMFHFKNFDVVQSPQDHHYLDNKEQGCGSRTNWIKRVQEEWAILETSLPDTIYVRAFEDRMDLLRAVMVGPSGTPYQDGLFFFDLQLPPSSYPAAPPLVKYHSFGLHVNPNLYPSGTVCLSLLNTFGGKGTELWSPKSSNILQVVVSIQGLVLTAQPYYNEAGYEAQVGTPEGLRNEIPYWENTYLVNLHTMLHLIRHPPAGFEAFVRDHFSCRGRHILHACEAYLQEACPIATLDGEAVAKDQASRGRSCSLGFRLALNKIVPRLDEAFTGIGAKA